MVAAGVEKKENRTEPLMTRGAVTDKIYLWTNGRVPYIIDSDFGKHKELIRNWINAFLVRAFLGRGGGRLLPDMGPQRGQYGLFAVLVINRVSILAILPSYRAWFLHSSPGYLV